jgi:hypothetical protein
LEGEGIIEEEEDEEEGEGEEEVGGDEVPEMTPKA